MNLNVSKAHGACENFVGKSTRNSISGAESAKSRNCCCKGLDGDNPPIGILLCTEKGPKMVQYVLNGMDEKLFVSTYKLQLPDREQLENFLIKEVKEMGL